MMDTFFHKRLHHSSLSDDSFDAGGRLMDHHHHLETFLTSQSPSPLHLDSSLSHIINSKHQESEKYGVIDSAMVLGKGLFESAKRLERRQNGLHNSRVWVLPPDVTINVFSMLDTRSLCHVAATCSIFNHCARDSMCYTNINLVSESPKITNAFVSNMVQRAGKSLRSLKLGVLCSSMEISPLPFGYTIRNSLDASEYPWNDKKSGKRLQSSALTRSCLSCLSTVGVGPVLKKLHLYNIERMDGAALCAALSATPSLLNLEIVGLLVELREIMESVSANCHGMERLFFESYNTARDDTLKSATCISFVNGCPHLTSLALRGFKLHDHKVRILIKGFRKLKEIDFSTSYSITGRFLKNLGGNIGGNMLEVIVLRDCMHLKEVEVGTLFTALLSGDYRFLKYLDVSNKDGLASNEDWYTRLHAPSLPTRQISQVRPEICLLAEFPPEEIICTEVDEIMKITDENSDISMSSLMLSSQSSAGAPMYTSSESSDGSDGSDDSSGNEDDGDLMYLDSSEEGDFLP